MNMLLASQETDRKFGLIATDNRNHSMLHNPVIETIGRVSDLPIHPYMSSAHITRQFGEILSQIENPEIAKEAKKLLVAFQQALLALCQLGISLNQLPPLRALHVEDGSFLIEWIFEDFRLGFTFEPNPDDSGWYLVSNGNLGYISASGNTLGVDLTSIVVSLVSFVVAMTIA